MSAISAWLIRLESAISRHATAQRWFDAKAYFMDSSRVARLMPPRTNDFRLQGLRKAYTSAILSSTSSIYGDTRLVTATNSHDAMTPYSFSYY